MIDNLNNLLLAGINSIKGNKNGRHIKKIDIILDQKNILKLLEIVDETHVHPQYEYIEVYFGSWKSFFRNKAGLIVSGAYSGKRECKSLIEGLNQLGAERWKIVHFESVLIDINDTYTLGTLDYNHNYSHLYDPDGFYFNRGNNYKYFHKKSYILEIKATPFFNQTILDFHSGTSNNLYKSPIIEKTREEEALEEYEHDTLFKEELNLSARAYACLKIADLASIEGLENLGYSSKSRIMEIANMEQDVAEEIMQWFKNFCGIEIAEED
ncbi:hypothetical protein PI95_025265 [Hassallia byssoidea VB512170]|uniref:RNA polymerase alpha subunit C-terminal domain-containing protein n=1 Tax=Hassallia byssoidea VB512170 TaxID=1304833 RepID=A0A846HEK8_9CYAN|nr:DNA-directed RNA polymerase subunit alpha C-terminal domain-containing protein [Hassalia byssoidea]NEU75775.1 hypothetical protein [Hassalia byssoidea VB512170]